MRRYLTTGHDAVKHDGYVGSSGDAKAQVVADSPVEHVIVEFETNGVRQGVGNLEPVAVGDRVVGVDHDHRSGFELEFVIRYAVGQNRVVETVIVKPERIPVPYAVVGPQFVKRQLRPRIDPNVVQSCSPTVESGVILDRHLVDEGHVVILQHGFGRAADKPGRGGNGQRVLVADSRIPKSRVQDAAFDDLRTGEAQNVTGPVVLRTTEGRTAGCIELIENIVILRYQRPVGLIRLDEPPFASAHQTQGIRVPGCGTIGQGIDLHAVADAGGDGMTDLRPAGTIALSRYDTVVAHLGVQRSGVGCTGIDPQEIVVARVRHAVGGAVVVDTVAIDLPVRPHGNIFGVLKIADVGFPRAGERIDGIQPGRVSAIAPANEQHHITQVIRHRVRRKGKVTRRGEGIDLADREDSHTCVGRVRNLVLEQLSRYRIVVRNRQVVGDINRVVRGQQNRSDVRIRGSGRPAVQIIHVGALVRSRLVVGDVRVHAGIDQLSLEHSKVGIPGFSIQRHVQIGATDAVGVIQIDYDGNVAQCAI